MAHHDDDGPRSADAHVVTATGIPSPRRSRRVLALALPPGLADVRLRLAVVAEKLVDGARRDLDDGLALPGLVVVFALGIALYFELPREPWLPAVIAAAVLAAAVTWSRRRRGHAARLAACVAALLLGVLAAASQTARVAAPASITSAPSPSTAASSISTPPPPAACASSSTWHAWKAAASPPRPRRPASPRR